MKKSVLFASFVAAVALTACQTTPMTTPITPPHATTNSTPAATVTLPLTDALLQRYDWQLISVTNAAGNTAEEKLFSNAKPLIVTFESGGKVRFVNTCNQMWGSYKLSNDNVLVGDIASTRMMCEPERMAFDMLAPTTLQGQFKLTQNVKADPLLTVTSSNQVSVFRPVILVQK